MKTKNKKIEEILEKDEENEKLSNYLKKKEKSNHAGITLVSLVVTIIILIILAGISINLTLGKEGIFTLAQRAKENTELAQIEEQEKLNALYTDLDFNMEGEGVIGGSGSYDAIQELIGFKRAIKEAIEEADGVITDIGAETKTFQDNIKGIVAEVTKDATAKAEDIAKDKTAWVNGKKIIGTNEKNSIGNNTFIKYMHWQTDKADTILVLDIQQYNTLSITCAKGNYGNFYVEVTAEDDYTQGTVSILKSSGRGSTTKTLTDYDISQYKWLVIRCGADSTAGSYRIEDLSVA